MVMDPSRDAEVGQGGIGNLPDMQRLGFGNCLMVSALPKGTEWGCSLPYPGLSWRSTARL